MLPYQFDILSPIIEPYLNALLSSGKYGVLDITHFELFKHLDSLVKVSSDPKYYDFVDKQLSTPVRHLTDTERVHYGKQHVDIINPNKQSFRSNDFLRERFNKQTMSLKDHRKIADPVTKTARASSSKFGRRVIDRINDLDDFAYSQQSLKPQLLDN